MKLSFKQTFILKGQNGQEAFFSYPYVNDEKELEFKYCSLFEGKVILNREKKALELRSERKKVFILLRGENESLFEECMGIRNEILNDLRELTKGFQSGNEPIYAIESGNEHYPYLITTPSMMENGQHSVKYEKAVLYFINERAKNKGKKTNIENYESLLNKVGLALKQSDLSEFKHGLFGDNKYYNMSIDKVVELL